MPITDGLCLSRYCVLCSRAQVDLTRVARATGATVQTSLGDLSVDVLGACAKFEERQIGDKRYNFFLGCKNAKSCSIILRGGAEQFIAEAERSLHDAICIVRRAVKHATVVAGGGAIEMELSRLLRDHAQTIHSKVQLIILAYAKALEVIPRTLADNAGFDSTDVVTELRARHAKGTPQLVCVSPVPCHPHVMSVCPLRAFRDPSQLGAVGWVLTLKTRAAVIRSNHLCGSPPWSS